jgi:hypothetical protein
MAVLVLALVAGVCSSGMYGGDKVSLPTAPPLLSDRAASILSYMNSITIANRMLGYPDDWTREGRAHSVAH